MGGGRTRALIALIMSFLEEYDSSEKKVAESVSDDDEMTLEKARACSVYEQASMNSIVKKVDVSPVASPVPIPVASPSMLIRPLGNMDEEMWVLAERLKLKSDECELINCKFLAMVDLVENLTSEARHMENGKWARVRRGDSLCEICPNFI